MKTKSKTKTDNMDNFTKLAIQELELDEKVKGWSYNQLAQYLIQNVWGAKDNKFGTLKCSVLDRVIQELFNLDDIEKIGKTIIKHEN